MTQSSLLKATLRVQADSHQHVGGVEVVLAGHVGLQSLGHLLDALNLIQQLEDVLVLDALDPQLP